MKIEVIKENFEIDVGAPMPTILSNEHILYLIFNIENLEPNWDGTSVNVRSRNDQGIVTVKFELFAQYKFGNPNDETISGHALYKLGLKPYSIYRVIQSDWIKELSQINSVHPDHEERQFESYEHFIFFFHDSCFEIVAEGYSIEKKATANIREEVQRIAKLL